MEYEEDDFLLLSGIQHFAFCRRQWALIHVEQQWEENVRTYEGRILHKNAHDSTFYEKRGDTVTVHAMKIFSRTLGAVGECDVVEFQEDPLGIEINGYKGKYRVTPIEYKRGKPKLNDEDELQLTAQAICLEEMLETQIEYGFLYYGETRHRKEIYFSHELRENVKKAFIEMHQYFSRRYTPKVKVSNSCKLCSLQNVCFPQLCKNISAKEYIRGIFEGEI